MANVMLEMFDVSLWYESWCTGTQILLTLLAFTVPILQELSIYRN